MGRIVPGTDAKAKVTLNFSNGKVLSFPAAVTVRPDGGVDFAIPQGRIVPGTDARVTINFSDGRVVSTGSMKITPGPGGNTSLQPGALPTG